MSLAILFHFLCAQHVSDINMSIIRSFCDCAVDLPHLSFLFCKDGGFSVSVHLWCVWCDVPCLRPATTCFGTKVPSSDF